MAARSMKWRSLPPEFPGGANLEPEGRKDRGLVRRAVTLPAAVLGAPGRAWSAHVVQLGPVRVEQVAGQFAPLGGQCLAEAGEGARQQGDCGTGYGDDSATHDTVPESRAL